MQAEEPTDLETVCKVVMEWLKFTQLFQNRESIVVRVPE